jgi:hypothetical protein
MAQLEGKAKQPVAGIGQQIGDRLVEVHSPPIRIDALSDPLVPRRPQFERYPARGHNAGQGRKERLAMDGELSGPDGRSPDAQEALAPYLDEIVAALGPLGYTTWLHDMVAVVEEPLTIQIRLRGNLPEALTDTIRRASRAGIAIEHLRLAADFAQVETAMLRLADALRAHHVDWIGISRDVAHTTLTIGVPEAALTETEVQRIRAIAADAVGDFRVEVAPGEPDALLARPPVRSSVRRPSPGGRRC